MSKKKKADKPGGPKFLTAQEVADRYGLTVKWVYGCLTLPRRKVGKYLVFREDELEEFELSWKKATPSYRVFKTKKEMGITGSHNDWPDPPKAEGEKLNEFKLKFDVVN